MSAILFRHQCFDGMTGNPLTLTWLYSLQDRFLPIANVHRIMKKSIPKTGKVGGNTLAPGKIECHFLNVVGCCQNAVNFLSNPHNSTPYRAGASTTRVLVLYKMINMNILKTLYSSTTRVLIFQYSYVQYSPQPRPRSWPMKVSKWAMGDFCELRF